MIRIITVGKRNLGYVDEGVREYQKRLRKPYDVRWELIANSAKNASEGVLDESGAIFKALRSSDYVILLDERGKNIDSPALSRMLAEKIEGSRDIVIIIGGAFGVSDELVRRADFVWSLSNLVFPHQLVRLILAEQIYRAQEIYLGHPYHHI